MVYIQGGWGSRLSLAEGERERLGVGSKKGIFYSWVGGGLNCSIRMCAE